MSDRPNEKPTIIQTSSGSSGWIFAIIVAMLLAAGVWYMYGSNTATTDPVNINIETPKVEAPKADAPAPAEVPAPAPAEAPAPAATPAPAAPAANP